MSTASSVKFAVIPVAGLGTRFLPATKTVPKEMLPIVDKPTLQYIVEEAFGAGVEHVVLVQGRYKGAIEDHFDTSYELEDTLEKRGKTADLEMIRSISKLGPISSIRQKAPLGLGHAVLCARPIVGDNPCAVLLGDDLYRTAPGKRTGIGQLIDAYDASGLGQVALMEVPKTEIHKYGAAKMEGAKIASLVEKPSTWEGETGHAVVGRYVLPAAIWSLLETTKPGKGGEIQLTDALDALRAGPGLMGVAVDGRRVDAGDKLGFLEANLREALSRADLHDGVLGLMRQLLDDPSGP